MTMKKFSIRDRMNSFPYAFNGLWILWKEEHNARIHFVAAICAVVAGVVLHISVCEWLAIVFAIGFVITLEIINSAIENIADFVSPERNEVIKKVKDLAAAGVLFSAFTALVIGLVIFVPKILDLF